MAERTIADRYVLESKLGSGGMGTVWKAHDTLLDRTVAVKLLHEGLAEDATFAERFRREARNAASLGHPNVVTVYDTGSDVVPFIVMEYVDGDSLHRLLSRQGPLPIEDTARIARSILAALDQAHSRSLVHRDMKPANVLFERSSGEAKVVDFGIAKGLEDTGGLTRTSGLIGTAAYLSPEQVSGHDATPASDLYAVGCLLYCCLTGEPPFSGTTPVAIAVKHLNEPVPSLRQRRPDVPADLEAAIMRALEKDPAHRFSSAAEMDAAIAATGLAARPSTDPTVVAVAPGAATVAMRQHPVGGTVAGTEVLRSTSAGGPPRAGGNGWLIALTAFLVAAAIAVVVVLWLQNREPGLLEVPPIATLEPTTAPVTTEPTPTKKPKETESPEPTTPTPCASLPGLDLPCPETPPPTATIEPTDPPTASPTLPGDFDDLDD
jgi:eukaryotic-like serine/threonine-protein kinase